MHNFTGAEYGRLMLNGKDIAHSNSTRPVAIHRSLLPCEMRVVKGCVLKVPCEAKESKFI